MCTLESSVLLLLYDCVAAECFQMNHMPPTSTWTEARSSLVCWKSSRRIKKSILLRSDSISRNLLPLPSPPLPSPPLPPPPKHVNMAGVSHCLANLPCQTICSLPCVIVWNRDTEKQRNRQRQKELDMRMFV